MRLLIMISLLFGTVFAQQEPAPNDARGWMNAGVQAYRGAQYQQAVQDFQKAVDLDPNNAEYRLYLGSTYMTQYVPGSESPENLAFADKATSEFARVLEIDPNNKTAIASMASLLYQEAQGAPNPEQKSQKLDQAREWYQKLIAVDPQNKEAYYSLGVIDWLKFYPRLMTERTRLGMWPETPGPLPDAMARQDLKTQYGAMIDDGLANLQKALDIDPQYDDAMAYMNLLIRERADVRDTADDYKQDVAAANAWARKALETRRMKAQTTTVRPLGDLQANAQAAPPPPPPPPPSQHPGVTPQRIRVSGKTEAANLIRRVEPDYPPLAKQARVQGTVRFTVLIAKDGTIENMQLVSGHPLLVAAAQDAVRQWVYKPTLLNGQPVEVVTFVEVNFTLSQ